MYGNAISSIGKRVGGKLYLHVSALTSLNERIHELVYRAADIARLGEGDDYNVVKLDLKSNKQLSLLNYHDFEDEPFPTLQSSWTVDLVTGVVRFRSYRHSENPPILHRKELLLEESHPRYEEFRALSNAAEYAGLFENASRIGFRKQWEQRLADRGYRLEGHHLVPESK